MLDKPYAGYRHRAHRMIPEPEPCRIGPLAIALLSALAGGLVNKALEKPEPGKVGQALDLKYEPTTKGALEAAQAATNAGKGTANVGRALAGASGGPPPPIPAAAGIEPYSTPPLQGVSAAGQGAEVMGPPKPTPEQQKANAQGEGSWMESAKLGSEIGGAVANAVENMGPRPGPTGGVVAHGSPNLETTLPSAKERLLRYLAMMQGQQGRG